MFDQKVDLQYSNYRYYRLYKTRVVIEGTVRTNKNKVLSQDHKTNKQRDRFFSSKS